MRRTCMVLTMLLLGCNSPTQSHLNSALEPAAGDRVRVLGTIVFGKESEITLLPQGRTVSVSISTFGPGCYRKGETEVSVQGLEAVVTPYNYAPPPGSPCTRDLRTFAHTATLPFQGSGTARIRVHGLSTATNPYGDPITIERSVRLE